uniref:Asparaginase n=1 Tax=Steinernema glaseri TaxID=37863 RepID=A0A1I7ZYA5_9BILA
MLLRNSEHWTTSWVSWRESLEPRLTVHRESEGCVRGALRVSSITCDMASQHSANVATRNTSSINRKRRSDRVGVDAAQKKHFVSLRPQHSASTLDRIASSPALEVSESGGEEEVAVSTDQGVKLLGRYPKATGSSDSGCQGCARERAARPERRRFRRRESAERRRGRWRRCLQRAAPIRLVVIHAGSLHIGWLSDGPNRHFSIIVNLTRVAREVAAWSGISTSDVLEALARRVLERRPNRAGCILWF